jgi:hypothetical protein
MQMHRPKKECKTKSPPTQTAILPSIFNLNANEHTSMGQAPNIQGHEAASATSMSGSI